MTQSTTPVRALSVAETGAALSVSRSTVMRLIADGELRAKRVGARVLIPVDEIDRFLTDTD
jgi:excisionase family DNA binding protein